MSFGSRKLIVYLVLALSSFQALACRDSLLGDDAKPSGLQTPKAAAAADFDDHQNMMDQLGIKKLRPGANSKDQSIYDDATANRYKDSLPDVLTMNDGTKVTQASQWPRRRAEIIEDFEREVYGRIPKDVPKVTWEVTETAESKSGDTSDRHENARRARRQ